MSSVMNRSSDKLGFKVQKFYDKDGIVVEDLYNLKQDDIIFCSKVIRTSLYLLG